MTTNYYFSKEKIIFNLSMYETMYQIALGKIVHLSNIQNISYEVDFQLALGSIYELLKDLETEANLDEIFEDELKKQIAMDALQFFVNENQNLIMEKNFAIEPLINEINDGVFYNEAMIEVYEENIKLITPKYEEFITDELSNAILKSLEELENNN
ncbi:hypothetical protein [Poseidonibacter lekithochrous]|uniref:hypothetical protein n=1 Tax=Poseidonibacter lekithochrous TaxID=1904463 RepID=UPI0008FCDC41|nr:hypothetical protein [Poseidonibacter lekithochrous]QKJ22490.1 hypothetical protein ALEK_1211 [Poseidonibacter lekithochrous]